MLGLQTILHELRDMSQLPALGRSRDRVLQPGSRPPPARRTRDQAVLGGCRDPRGRRRGGRRDTPRFGPNIRDASAPRLRAGGTSRRSSPAHLARTHRPDRGRVRGPSGAGRPREPLGRRRPDRLAVAAGVALGENGGSPASPRIFDAPRTKGRVTAGRRAAAWATAWGSAWVAGSAGASVAASDSVWDSVSGSESGWAWAQDPSTPRS